MQYILKCKNVGSSTYIMDLVTTIQDICKSENKNETNMTITFTMTNSNRHCFSSRNVFINLLVNKLCFEY